MLPHINLSTDTAIFATIAVVVVVGLALGRDRLRHFALTVYMGLALAYELGGPLTNFVNGHGQSFTMGTVKLALLIAPILLLAFGGKQSKHKNGQNLIMTLITGVLLACLLIASALDLMDHKTAASFLGQSQIALSLYNLRLVWLGSVPVSILLGLFIKPKKTH